MAGNIFAQNPLSIALDEGRKRREMTMQERGIGGASQAPTPTFEGISSEHQVPVNILMSMSEGMTDSDALSFAGQAAQRLAPRLRAGESVTAALDAEFGSIVPPETMSAMLERAKVIGDKLYPVQEADGGHQALPWGEEDPFDGEGAAALLARRGQQVAAGATDVVASVPEAAALASRNITEQNDKIVSLQISRLTEERDALNATIAENGLDSDAGHAAANRLKVVEFTLNQQNIRSDVADEIRETPVAETQMFQLGDDLRSASENLFGKPDERDTGLWGKVATGVGNMGGFVLASLLGGGIGGTAGALVAGGGAGSALTGSQLYKEAIDAGADEETALEAARWGSLIGASEVIPIAHALKYLPSSVRAKLAKGIVGRFASVVGNAGEEAAQEFLATAAQNLVAQEYYDPDRGWADGAGEAALIGAILGGGMGVPGAIRGDYATNDEGDPDSTPPPSPQNQPEGFSGLKLTPEMRADTGPRVLQPSERVDGPAPAAPPVPPSGPLGQAAQSGPAPISTELDNGQMVNITTSGGMDMNAQFIQETPDGILVKEEDGTTFIVPREEIESGEVQIGQVVAPAASQQDAVDAAAPDTAPEPALTITPEADNLPSEIAPTAPEIDAGPVTMQEETPHQNAPRPNTDALMPDMAAAQAQAAAGQPSLEELAQVSAEETTQSDAPNVEAKRNGQLFASEAAANQALKNRRLDPLEYDIVPEGDGFTAVSKQGAEMGRPNLGPLAEGAAEVIRPSEADPDTELTLDQAKSRLEYLNNQGRTNGWGKKLIEKKREVEAISAAHNPAPTSDLTGTKWESREGPREVIGSAPDGRYLVRTGDSNQNAILSEADIEQEQARDAANLKAKKYNDEELVKHNVKAKAKAGVDGFTKGMTPFHRGRAEKVLGFKVKNNGKMVSRGDLIRARVKDGATVERAENDDVLMLPDGAYLTRKALTKTGMDYAKHLVEQNAEKPAKSTDSVSKNPAKAEKPEPKVSAKEFHRLTQNFHNAIMDYHKRQTTGEYTSFSLTPARSLFAKMVEKGDKDTDYRAQLAKWLRLETGTIELRELAKPFSESGKAINFNDAVDTMDTIQAKMEVAKPAVVAKNATTEQAETEATAEPTTADEVEQAAAEADPTPTDAQKEAGNYKLGHVIIHGLDVSIENAKGSERSGKDADGEVWSVTMPAAYGYIKRTEGADGDHVDVYIGDNPESEFVLVVDQVDLNTGRFDEHKVILGAKDADTARAIYEGGFSDGKGAERIGGATEMTVTDFKAWLEIGDQSKPAASPKDQGKAIFDRLETAQTRENTEHKVIETKETPMGVAMLSRGEPVAVLSGKELGNGLNIRQLQKSARDWYRDNLSGSHSTMEQTGWDVKFTTASAKKTTFTHHQDLLKMVPALREIISNGRLVATEPYRGAKKDFIAVHKVAATVEIAGVQKDVIVTIREHKNGHFQYTLSKDNSADARFSKSITNHPERNGDTSKAPDGIWDHADNLNIYLDEGKLKVGIKITDTTKPYSLIITPRFREKAKAVKLDLIEQLQKIGIANKIKVKVAEHITALTPSGGTVLAHGFHFGNTIGIALKGARMTKDVMNHEAIHALKSPDLWGGREYGLFTQQEWRALVAHARKDKARMAHIKRLYHDLDRAGQVEEAIADIYAEWADGNIQQPTKIEQILQKMQDFFEAIGNALRGNGFQSANDVFRSISEGEIGKRQDWVEGPLPNKSDIKLSSKRNEVFDLARGVVSALERKFGEKISVNLSTHPTSWGNSAYLRVYMPLGDTSFYAKAGYRISDHDVGERRQGTDEYPTVIADTTSINELTEKLSATLKRGTDAAAEAHKERQAQRDAEPPHVKHKRAATKAWRKIGWEERRDKYHGYDRFVQDFDSGIEHGMSKAAMKKLSLSLNEETPNRGIKLSKMDMDDFSSETEAQSNAKYVQVLDGAVNSIKDNGAAAWKQAVRVAKGVKNGDALTQAMSGDKASLLGLVPGRNLFTELGKELPSAQQYIGIKQEMDAVRNEWHAKTDKVAQKWRKIMSKRPKTNKALMDLMHQSTLAQVDPSMPFASVLTDKDKAVLAAGSGKNKVAYEAALEKQQLDKQRKLDHSNLAAEFDHLPIGFQKMFRQVRDTYAEMDHEFDRALMENMKKVMATTLKGYDRRYDAEIERINDEGLTGAERTEAIEKAKRKKANAKARAGWGHKARVIAMRQQFESNRLTGPYFPLGRFGQFAVTVRDAKTGKVKNFSRFEKKADQTDFAKEMHADNSNKVEVGIIEDQNLKEHVDANFVAEVEQILGDSNVDQSVMDAVWQKWLQDYVPELSLRKSNIHRKGIPGYSSDAFRVFGRHVMHGAHQLARLKYGLDLGQALEDAGPEARKAKDPVRTGLVLEEMKRRHKFTMNPTGAVWATTSSSIAFTWYLAMTPAAAMVNISQTTVIGIPMLETFYGKGGSAIAAKEIARASKDFTKGAGWTENSKNLNSDEKAALKEAYRMSTIDATNAHDIAGVAESGVKYSDTRTKWMGRLSFLFHHAERFNREVTFMAAYRMARKKGHSHDEAIGIGSNLTWKTHFDYQNTSRPRVMQGDVAKVVLTFRNYQANMIWRLFRDTHQMLKGETKADRKEALHQLGGITAMMALHAGIRGTWLFGLAMTIAGLFWDEPEEELKKGAVALLGPTGASLVLNGVPGTLTGMDLSERIGMPDLLFRSSGRDLDGSDEYNYWLTQTLGASVGLVERGFRGVNMMMDGEVWRGVETLAPKFVRDQMKAVRFHNEGALTYRGDPLIEDVSIADQLKQAIGFTPAALAERYETNNWMENREKRIRDARSDIQREAGSVIMDGGQLSPEILAQIRSFNEENPTYPITAKTLRLSIMGRQRASANNEYGTTIIKSLNEVIRREAAPLISQ